MSEEEQLTLNGYMQDLYEAMQIGDIVFEPKHSYELYNLINKLLEENKQLKEQLENRDILINKIRKIFDDGHFEDGCDCIIVEKLLEKSDKQ